MTHQQILDKAVSRFTARAMDEELAYLVFNAMCGVKHNWADSVKGYVLPKLLMRWNCLLEDNEVKQTDKQATILCMAVLLHKYGIVDDEIIQNTIKAIDGLNEAIVLSEDFERKSGKIKEFLLTPPTELKRKPSVPDTMTFYREKDIITIKVNGKYGAAYIHTITGYNEAPVIEIYDYAFDHMPTLDELKGKKALSQKFNDGSECIGFYKISGLKYMPDPANQIHLIAACVDEKPVNSHLKKSIGLWTGSDVFDLQDKMSRIIMANSK